MNKLVEVYRNSVQAWECDQMGHLNVQFYLDKAASGTAVLAQNLGLGPDFVQAEGAQLQARNHHIRFHREQRAGAPICIHAGILATHQNGLTVYLELTNPATAEVAATFVVETELARPGSPERLHLPHRALDRAEKLIVDLPEQGAPRGLELYAPQATPTLGQADSLGMRQTYLGPVLENMCGANGRLADRSYMAVISDAVPNLLTDIRRTAEPSRRIGGAALEYRLVYHSRPRVGDILCLRSAIKALDKKAYTLGHWLFDYCTGEVVAAAEAVAVMFDLQERKAIELPPAARSALEKMLVPDFSV